VYSIRRRLMLVLAVGFMALILSTGVYVSNVVSDRVTAEFDAALLMRAQGLVQLVEDEAGQVEFDYTPKHMPEFERAERPEYFQFWLVRDSGSPETLLASTGLRRAERDLPHSEPPPKEPAVRDVRLPDGRAGRMVELTFVPKGPEDIGDKDDQSDQSDNGKPPARTFESVTLVLAVARGREHLDEALGNMQFLMYGVGGIAILIACLLVWRTLAVGFRPIDSVAAQVEKLDAHNLSLRIELPQASRELAPVADQLNALLGRLHASFERERRFADNVAHELRTPIAELRSLAAVGAKWPGDEASVTEFFSDVDDIASRMEGVVADLLLLARCQAGIEQVERAPTSLRQVIASTWAKLDARASGAGLHFCMDVPDDMVVESDPSKLGIVFANILGNAVSYARPNTEIRCVVITADSRLRLDITNDADPLSRADLENLAEPFWRKDKARSSAEHVGLGLSLVSALARLLSLTVRFDQDGEGKFRVAFAGWALA